MRINSHHFPHETTWKVVTYMDARLEPYRTLVSFLGEALGPDYEVVLHPDVLMLARKKNDG